VTDRSGRLDLATTTTDSPETAGMSWSLADEETGAETYRPELVARLERAVRLGRYRPDARAIAGALLNAIDALG
jgi:anti-sigma28 factor (negative regulator of flagellin synthesis)